MPYVNKPRPYKKEYQQQLARGEADERLERQRARESFDKGKADRDGNGAADARQGKDLAPTVRSSVHRTTRSCPRRVSEKRSEQRRRISH
jgi:hypothetical protein